MAVCAESVSVVLLIGITAFAHKADRHVGVALGGVLRRVLRLCAAVRALGIVCTALDGVLAIALGCRPLPAVAPKVDAARRSFRLRERIHGADRIAYSTIKIGILRHVSGGKFPFLFRREAVNVRRIALPKPLAVFCRVRDGYVGYGVFLRPRRDRLPRELGEVLVRDGRVCDRDVFRRAEEMIVLFIVVFLSCCGTSLLQSLRTHRRS